MRYPNYSVEKTFSGMVCGIDEVGRGPLAGPVVAAAVILNPKRAPRGIDDSKKLTRDEREALYEKLTACAQFAVGMASAAEIDLYNILEASKLAMARAVEALEVKPDVALVDGNQPPKLPCKIHMVVGGDAKCMSIAAASIIAKVTRDRIMHELAQHFPHYGWETNAGYGTAQHHQALAHHGVTPHHRRSFAPVRAFLEATDLFNWNAA